MTRMTNARVAGSAFLLYIILGLPAGMLMARATGGAGIAAKLAGAAQHANDLRAAVVLVLFSSFCALVLGATLYAITRQVDQDLAMLALTFRVGEGVIGGISVQRSLGLLWVATATGANAPDIQTAHALGTLFTGQGGTLGSVGALFFAVGSTIFSWLLLRGRVARPHPNLGDFLADGGVRSSVRTVAACQGRRRRTAEDCRRNLNLTRFIFKRI